MFSITVALRCIFELKSQFAPPLIQKGEEKTSVAVCRLETVRENLNLD